MQFNTAKDIITGRLHNPTTTSFDDLAGEWLNEIMHDLVSRNPEWSWLQAESSLALVADQSSYAISSIASDVAQLHSISIDDPPLVFKPKDSFSYIVQNADPDERSGTPEIYTVWSNNLLFSPVPDESDTATVWYWKHVVDLSDDTDMPPWPARFDRVWIQGAYALGLFYLADVRAEQANSKYEKLISNMLGADGIQESQQILSSPYSRRKSMDVDFDPMGYLASIYL